MKTRKQIRTITTRNLDRMNHWCARLNRLLGIADDCVAADGYTAVRWNRRIKIIYRYSP